jgi:hypothetical protein
VFLLVVFRSLLLDMALKYPISQAEVDKYSQRRRKQKKYGAEFVP